MTTSPLFDQVMERLSARVYTLARYSLGSPQDAEDVTQEVFIRLWEHWPQIDLDRVEGWLIRVTSNACVDFRRKRIARAESQGSALLAQSPSTETGPTAALESHELQSQVTNAIARLDEPYRTVLILREIEGLSYIDIGAALNLSMPSVKVTLHRARAKLTQLLEPLREADARVH